MERVHFRALFDIDLQFYALLDTEYQLFQLFGSSVFNGQKSCFWFPPKVVRAGENVVIYTRAGVPNVENRKDNSVFHFYFRGLPNPIYQPVSKCAVLFEINSWITTPWGG